MKLLSQDVQSRQISQDDVEGALPSPYGGPLRLKDKGALKEVYEGYDYSSKAWVAIKVLNPTAKGWDIIAVTGSTLQSCYQAECRLLADRYPGHARHLSLLRSAHALQLGKDTLHILVEDLCDGHLGRIEAELFHGRSLPLKKTKYYIRQILRALRELKRVSIDFHGDLKLQNILVSCRKGRIILKLTDFSGSGIAHGGKNIGYPITMAPELLDSHRSPSLNTDLWSVGMLLYRFCTGSYLVDFAETPDWVAMPIEERIAKFDRRIKQDLLELGQHGIQRKITAIGHDPLILEVLNKTLLIDPEAREWPSVA